MNNSFEPSHDHLLAEALQNNELSALEVFYDLYAAVFYGDIKRVLYKQSVSDQTLLDAFNSIWGSIAQFDSAREHLFTWSLKMVRKEISKKKVDILLHEIFGCQHVKY